MERKRVWYLLFVHMHNYPLLNTCLAKVGGERSALRLISEVPSHWKALEGAGEQMIERPPSSVQMV